MKESKLDSILRRVTKLEERLHNFPVSVTVVPQMETTWRVGGKKLQQTDRAREAVALAECEAKKLGHNYVDTGHLLLGLLAEDTGIAAMALKCSGVNLQQLRQEVLYLLDLVNPEKEKAK